MPAIHIEGFQGAIPKMAPTALQNVQAQRADNCRLYGADIDPWRKPFQIYKAAYPVAQPILSIYHMIQQSTGNDRWLTWTLDTDCVDSPVPDPTETRVYYTNANGQFKANWAMASSGNGPYPGNQMPMGIPNPVTAPTLAANGTGSGTAVTRAYTYTWVNQFGTILEESAPANAAQVNWQSGQTVTVSGFQAPPGAPYNFQYIRIYRTVTNSAGTASYLEVAQIPANQASYVDNLSDAQIPGSALSTIGFTAPPSNMIGLVMMPNGFMAGFFGNTLCFSEPYLPYAWPAIYQQPLAFSIVGLGVYGQSLVVATIDSPYILTGIHPAQLTVTRVALREPCVAKRSITADMSGVAYASANGLVGISGLVQGIVTNGMTRRTDWQKMNPTNFTSVIYNGQYFGFHADTIGDSASGGWAEAFDKSENTYLSAATRSDVASFFSGPPKTRLDFWANAAYVDRITAAMYLVNKHDNCIYQMEADPAASLNATWHSKRFILPQPANMSAIQVDADYELTDVPLASLVQRYVLDNQTYLAAHPNTDLGGGVNEKQVNGGGQRQAIGNTMGTVNGSPYIWDIPSLFDFTNLNVRVYASDTLVYTYNPLNLEPVRMYGGFKSRIWEIEVTSNFRVRSLSMATSMEELKKV